MEIFFLVLFSFLMSLPILIALMVLFKSFLKYPSFYTIELIFASLFILLWCILIIPSIISPELIKFEDIEHFEILSSIFGTLALIVCTFVLANTLPSNLSFIPRITITNASFLVGMRFVQLLLSEITLNQETFVILISIIIQYVLVTIIVLLYSLIQLKMPQKYLIEKSKNFWFLAFVFLLLGIMAGVIGDLSQILILRIVSRVLASTGFMFFITYIWMDPILTFNEKGNPLLFIKNGNFGYLFVNVKETGPECLIESKSFKQNYTISSLEFLTLKLMTSISLDYNEFSEQIFSIPYNFEEYKFISIAFSFQITNKDNLKLEKDFSENFIYAIVIPSFLFPYLENLNFKVLKSSYSDFLLIFKNPNIPEIENILEKITFNVIRGLTTK